MTRAHEPQSGRADVLVRHALDATLDTLPAADVERLRDARRRALARRASPALTGRLARPWWSGGALATAALLLVMLDTNLARHPPDSAAFDAELIGSAASLELLEDLEFYEWLDDDDTTG